MEKLSTDEIANIHEIPLINHLECPIDSMISLNPVICDKCETLFCPDCVDTWKKRSNTCPMCKTTPFETINNLEKHIMKDQINKIKLFCQNYDSGCLTLIAPNEIDKHSKTCEYRKVRCPKCSKDVTFIETNSHYFDVCIGTRIKCIICCQEFNLKYILDHMKSCTIDSLCNTCFNNPSNNHAQECTIKIDLCSRCNLPDTAYEIKWNGHKCLEAQINTNLNAYFKCLHSKLDNNMKRILQIHDDRQKEFLIKFNELTSDLINRESQEYNNMEIRITKFNEDLNKKKLNYRKDKSDTIIKLKNELEDLKGKINSKI